MHYLRGLFFKRCLILDGARPNSSVFASDIITVITPEHASNSTIADEKNCSQKYDAAYRAGFSFKEETSQIQNHEHYMGLKESRVDRFGYQQYRDEPLKTIHCMLKQSNIILQAKLGRLLIP